MKREHGREADCYTKEKIVLAPTVRHTTNAAQEQERERASGKT